jgi:hypothetical protein
MSDEAANDVQPDEEAEASATIVMIDVVGDAETIRSALASAGALFANALESASKAPVDFRAKAGIENEAQSGDA